jgi:hypothetical protein
LRTCKPLHLPLASTSSLLPTQKSANNDFSAAEDLESKSRQINIPNATDSTNCAGDKVSEKHVPLVQFFDGISSGLSDSRNSYKSLLNF